jgi:hypothetical protein
MIAADPAGTNGKQTLRTGRGVRDEARLFVSQRQQGVALGAGEQPAAVFAQEHGDEKKDQP